MPIGLLFWMLLILTLIFRFGPWWPLGGSILTFVLFCLLGWKMFGPPLRG